VSGYEPVGGWAYFCEQNSALSPTTDGVWLWFTPPAAEAIPDRFPLNIGNGEKHRPFQDRRRGGYAATSTTSDDGHVSILVDASDTKVHHFRLSAVEEGELVLFYGCE